MRCKQQHLYLFSAFVFLALVAINIWYWRRRQRMTPEERRAEDAATRIDTQPLGTEAFVPLSFEWSEAFQFDWSEEGLVIGWDSHVGGSRHPEDAEPVVPLTANEQRPARFQRAGAPRSAAVECLLELRDVELHLS